MGYEHCEKHDRDATNGCELCTLERSHFHLCSDRKFCFGNGSWLCTDSRCERHLPDCEQNLSGCALEPLPCALCNLGRKLESELGELVYDEKEDTWIKRPR